MAQDNQSQSTENFDEKKWLQQEHGKVLEYASRNALELSGIVQQSSAILPPAVAIWFIESKTNSQGFWIISGDLPTDHIVGDNAKNAREAIKHFTLRWQLKAENILKELEQETSATEGSNTRKEFAEILISRAEGLYQLADRDDLWHKN